MMNDQPKPFTQIARSTAPTGAKRAEHWSRPLLERQIWILGQLAEGGLEIAHAIKRRAAKAAADAPSHKVVQDDASLVCARSVRLTLMLRSKLIRDLQALDKAQADQARSDKSDRAPVLRLVHRAAEASTLTAKRSNGRSETPPSGWTRTTSTPKGS